MSTYVDLALLYITIALLSWYYYRITCCKNESVTIILTFQEKFNSQTERGAAFIIMPSARQTEKYDDINKYNLLFRNVWLKSEVICEGSIRSPSVHRKHSFCDIISVILLPELEVEENIKDKCKKIIKWALQCTI